MLGLGKKKLKTPDTARGAGKKEEFLKGVTFHIMPSLAGIGELKMANVELKEKTLKAEQEARQKIKRPSLVPVLPEPKTATALPSAPPPKPVVMAKPPPLAHGAGKIAASGNKRLWFIVILGVLLLAAGILVYLYFTTRTPLDTKPEKATVSPSVSADEIGTEDNQQAARPSREPGARSSATGTAVYLADRGLVSAVDTDADALTDLEEELYGTDPGMPDTDADGWPDGWEIVNLYDPNAAEAGRLIESPRITGFQNEKYGYAVLYPDQWIVQAVDQRDTKEVVVSSATGEFIRIAVEALSANERAQVASLGFESWIRKKYSAGSAYTLHPLTNTFGVRGLQTADGLTVFLEGRGVVYVVRYEPGLREEIHFKRTFAMITAGFLVEEEESEGARVLDGTEAENTVPAVPAAGSATGTADTIL